MIAALAHPDIKKVIQKYSSSFSDEQHRFHSWNHCFTYFNSEKPFDAQIAALHLAFYLASWGMYRGSSFLLQKDYTVHIVPVEILTKYKCLAKIDFLNLEKSSIEYEKIFELKEELVKYYIGVRKASFLFSKKDVISDTLVTKVILGALGCVPAYDRYFKIGLKVLKIDGATFNAENFWKIVEFYKKNSCIFITAQTHLGLIGVTTMRLVDMYFWQVGYDNSPKETKK